MVLPGYSGNLEKKPNVAGQFYPAHPKQLASQIDDMLAAAKVEPTDQDVQVLIAPHAGYMYSGPVAAYGYRAVSSLPVKTVIVMAPSHYFGFNGISVWPSGRFQTPLGNLEVDDKLAEALLKKNKAFIAEPRAFDQEHALEVHLPFLQRTFTNIKIVPVIIGQYDFALAGELAQALDEVIGERKDILVIASTDMSHFHDAAFAKKMDSRTIEAIKNLDAEGFWRGCESREFEMCGWHPVTAAILFAKRRGLSTEFLRYAHSGDVTGDMNRVVGYTAFLFYKKASPKAAAEGNVSAPAEKRSETKFSPAPAVTSSVEKSTAPETPAGIPPLSVAQKKRLMDIAVQTVQTLVKTGKKYEVSETDPRLRENEGAFVTIRKQGQLRGCIGHIIAQEPLYLTVRDMAVAAASEDPRFPPVSSEELDKIDVEISVLSQPRPTQDANEIKMGVHGVIVRRGIFNQGVFLPQVATETGWSREEFLSELCSQKAGLPRDCWKDPQTKLEIFTADVFSEQDFK